MAQGATPSLLLGNFKVVGLLHQGSGRGAHLLLAREAEPRLLAYQGGDWLNIWFVDDTLSLPPSPATLAAEEKSADIDKLHASAEGKEEVSNAIVVVTVLIKEKAEVRTKTKCHGTARILIMTELYRSVT